MMKKTSLASLVFAVALLLGACGKNPNSSVTFGPSSKTSPSGYTFDVELSQTVISALSSGGVIHIRVHVWTDGGGAAVNVPIFIGGDVTAPTASFVTDSQGFEYIMLTSTTNVTAGHTGRVTITVENQTVMGAYQVVP
ncbi:MAG: hypothetical protein HY098_02330 [Nitrospinae bacterium]|nr:hypothetical protein [Nitrospinota bacterium]